MSWQDVVALSVVLVAVGYLLRQLWPGRMTSSGCGSACTGCSTANQPTVQGSLDAGGEGPADVIPIDQLSVKTRGNTVACRQR